VKHGLKNELLRRHKKGIGDGGYNGHQEAAITPNAHDCKAVRKFKSRALKRQEKFNGLIKKIDCTSGQFRHGTNRYKNCFEAVCVICQYQIENDSPLYDILVDGLMDDLL
jgi:hypothetical protein